MNPRVALVILIVLVVFAIFVLGLSIEGGGLGDSRNSDSDPEDSDWSTALGEKLLIEEAFGPEKVAGLKTKAGSGDKDAYLSKASCLREEGGKVYATRTNATCRVTFPGPPKGDGDDGPFPKPEVGTRRVIALKAGTCEGAADAVELEWNPKIGKTMKDSDGDWPDDDRVGVVREGGTLTIKVKGSGNAQSSRCELKEAPKPEGEGCSAAGGGPSAWWALVGVVLVRRRRT